MRNRSRHQITLAAGAAFAALALASCDIPLSFLAAAGDGPRETAITEPAVEPSAEPSADETDSGTDSSPSPDEVTTAPADPAPSPESTPEDPVQAPPEESPAPEPEPAPEPSDPPTPEPTPAPEPEPAPIEDDGTNAMPTDTDHAGFEYAGGLDFLTPAPAGQVAPVEWDDRETVYGDWIIAYDDWTGNWGGEYRFQENVSVADGILSAEVGMRDGIPTGSAWIVRHPEGTGNSGASFTYGAVEQRIRFVGHAPAYGAAVMLWPSSDVWGDGEIDFPEGAFDKEPLAYHHCLGDRTDAERNCSVFQTGLSDWSEWHIYRVEWTPHGTYYYVDGRLIGSNHDATPTTPHHQVTQMVLWGDESWEDTTIPTQYGVYQLDWIVFEDYVG